MANRSPNIRIRENRTSIPPGYVLGRVDAGKGAVQLIHLGTLAQQLLATGVLVGPGTPGPPGVNVLQTETHLSISAEDGSVITV